MFKSTSVKYRCKRLSHWIYDIINSPINSTFKGGYLMNKIIDFITHRNKSTKISVTIILALIILFLSLFISAYKQYLYYKNETAVRNYNNWCEILNIADQVYNIQNFEDLASWRGYINGVIYSTHSELLPYFRGEPTYTYFLTINYDSFIADVVSENNFNEEKRNEAFLLLKDVSLKLRELCGKILEISEKDKFALIETDSEIYKKAEKLIHDFCYEQGERIYNFSHSQKFLPYT